MLMNNGCVFASGPAGSCPQQVLAWPLTTLVVLVHGMVATLQGLAFMLVVTLALQQVGAAGQMQ